MRQTKPLLRVLAVAALLLGGGCAGTPTRLVGRPVGRGDLPLSKVAADLSGTAQGQPATARPVALATTVTLGHSVRGWPLIMTVFGDAPQPTFIFGGIHGDEPLGADLARRLADWLAINPDAWRERSVAILADANPDGLARGSRYNATGVDLNRNFPATNWRPGKRFGPRAASEPETRAILRAVEMLKPGRIVAIHTCLRRRHCNNYDGPAKDLAHLMNALNGYPVRATIGYPTPGSFGSWAGLDRHIPTLTLELPDDLTGPEGWQDNGEALLALIGAEGLALGK
jgi:hypothetical protein